MIRKYLFTIIFHIFWISTVYSQVDSDTCTSNAFYLNRFNAQLSVSGPFLISIGLTYKIIDKYGLSFSILPTNYVFKGYFKIGIFYSLIEENAEEKPIKFSLNVGFNTAIVDYPHFWTRYTGRCYWLDSEANFIFRSGINLFVRNGIGYIKESDNKNFIGPLFLVPEIGIGYKF
ncbi:MAG: hypothetical protein C0425_11370 [Chlorobiaceae bacterium]|nr:hypothetical protein [Chlorobiaceae bacterium]